MKNGEVDFAIITTPAEVESGLKMVELKPFYEVLVGGRTFTALSSQNLSLKELNNYPLISLSDESMTRAFYRQFFLDHGAVLKPDTEAATTDQMLTLVKSELGIAFLPQSMAQDALARGEIVQLHLQEIIPQRSICLVYDHHRPLNTAARKFQQMLTKAAPNARNTDNRRAFPCKLIYTGLLQNSSLKKQCTKPGTFSQPKRLKKGSGFLILCYFFVQVAIAFLFCNSPLFYFYFSWICLPVRCSMVIS